jgi:hypothetical protein
VIRHIEQAKDLRLAGGALGRVELAERVIQLVDASFGGLSYKESIELAGRMKAIAQACKFDSYWEEKAGIGFEREYKELLRRAKAKTAQKAGAA